ncbi:hypothetical protein WME94_53065 [Sorangium sp. So ce429]
MSVGLEIAIEKRVENDVKVEYTFLVREGRGGFAVPNATGRPGRASISKATGDVALEEPCPDDTGSLLFSRVVGVLKRHWKAGVYPTATWWAG